MLKVSGEEKKSTHFPQRWQGRSTVQNICSLHCPLTGRPLSFFPGYNSFLVFFQNLQKTSSHLLCETRVTVESRDLARGVRQHRPRPQRNIMRWWGGIFPTDWPGVQARQGQERVCNKETVQKSAPESHGNCSIVEKGRANLERGVAMDKEDLK